MMRRARDERGVSAVFISLLMVVLLVSAAFAVDLGSQRVVRRDMQAVADVVALDLARQLDGRTKSELNTDLTAALDKSVARNAASLGDPPDVSFELGELDSSGSFASVADTAVPTAVRVTSKGSVDFAFGGITGDEDGKGEATRRAVAEARDQGCMRVGTMVLSLATNQSALNGLLGNLLGTTLVGYDGLADADVSLLDIAAHIAAGSPGEVAIADVTMDDFVAAAAEVLPDTTGNEAAVQALEALEGNVELGDISVGDVLGVATDDDAALGTEVNLLDMVSGAAFIANGTNAIAVPGLNLNVLGLTNITTKLYVTETPQRGCLPGTGQASTAQVRLEIGGDLLNVKVPLIAELTGKVKVTVSLADAVARLRRISCVNGTPTSERISVVDQNLARTEIDLSDVRAKALVGLINVPLLGLKTGTNQPAVEGVYDLALPTYYWKNAYQTPQTPASLPQVSSTDLSLLGLNLGGILDPVLNQLLNPLLNRINSMIVNQLAAALGLRIAGIDLFAVKTPTCAEPRLVG